MSEPVFALQRQEMLAQIAVHTVLATGRLGKASLSRRVLDAIGSVPRHAFVPADLQSLAYVDSPLPIGHGKTISQPFIVALMTDLLDLQPGDRVLEVGTGLGYQTAVLAALAKQVYSVELIPALAAGAARRLAQQGCRNVEIRVGDGRAGWPEHAPFDKILVSAAPDSVPPALLQQLGPGGRMVLPAGAPDAQQLVLVARAADGTVTRRDVLPVAFSLLDTPD